MKYIPAEQLEAAKAADPVPRFRRQLIDAGVCTDDELDGIDDGALIDGRVGPEGRHGGRGADDRRVGPRRVRRRPIAFPV